MRELVGHKGYFATEEGEILDSNHNPLRIVLAGDGYKGVTIRGTVHRVHSLVLSAFEPPPSPKHIPNHFNLDKTDNRLVNLDWVTQEWNNIHQVLIYKKNPNRPHIKATKGKDSISFNTLDDAAEHFNITLKECWLALKDNVSLNGYSLEYLKWDHPDVLKVVKDDSIKRKDGKSLVPRAIKILDVITKEIETFDTLLDAAKRHDVLITHIRNRISTKEKPRVFNKRYIITDVDGNFDYLDDQLIKRLLDRGNKPVAAFNGKTKEVVCFKSAYAFIKERGLKKCRSPITKNLKDGVIRETSGWIYTYLDEESEFPPAAQLVLKLFNL